MNGTAKKDRTSRLRATRVYLLIILACAFLLFSFSLISLNDQREKVKELSSSNLEPMGEHTTQNQERWIGSGAARSELWFIGSAAFMFLCILSLGLYLLIHVSSDIRWFRQRSDFVSGVSHEFKTPLSLIRLYSETLSRNDEEFSSEDRKNYIRIIARESERMSRLIENVLDFSKMEQGGFHHELMEGDLAATVTQTVADYAEYLEWQGFSVKSSIWPHLLPVRYNAEQVSQVVLNLLDNARKYSGNSRLIRVNLWMQDDEVVVEVRDHGLGIPVADIEKIFQPFYRASRGSEQGGCGLGLCLVDEVMKEHGGRVEVESEVDMGSCFRLYFPVIGSARARHKQPNRRESNKVRSKQEAQSL